MKFTDEKADMASQLNVCFLHYLQRKHKINYCL